MRFFTTELGPHQLILGYPWFAAIQPRIDWAKGWIDYTQLLVVLRSPKRTPGKFSQMHNDGTTTSGTTLPESKGSNSNQGVTTGRTTPKDKKVDLARRILKICQSV